jgi:hypothetical protein
MSITLDLPQELESELATEATQLGLSLTEYVLRLLSTRSLVGQLPTTGAELVAYWQREDVIGTRPEITDSQAHARQIRRQAGVCPSPDVVCHADGTPYGPRLGGHGTDSGRPECPSGAAGVEISRTLAGGVADRR